MSASSRVREHATISLVFTSRQRSLPFCKLRERCKPERPKNDQNRARCWLPQHAQQGQKKSSTIAPKCSKSSPRAPKSLPRAPKELSRSSTELPKSSKERRRSPQISQQSPSSSQGLSKVRPKGLQGTLMEAFWDDFGLQIEVSEPMLAHFLS